MWTRLKKTYEDFPNLFWIIVITYFVDSIGSAFLFPFLALYITQKFGVGMTQAGVLLGLSSLFGLTGSLIGGAVTDRFGRRRIILAGLVLSALSSLFLGLAWDIRFLYVLMGVIGLLSRFANPAYDAMLADILPESKRQEAFGITRVVFNLAWIFGTALGGLLAVHSFLTLFVADAVISLTVAAILYRVLPETQPLAPGEGRQTESLLKSITGYGSVLRDLGYMVFTAAGMIALLVYQQQYGSLSVYLRDVHGISPQTYGALLSIAGMEVVLFQIGISRAIRRHPPFLVMVFGTIFFVAGFSLLAFVQSVLLFMLCITLITVGEMITFPTNRVIAAKFAPIRMRGRYMAIYDLGWALPATIGPVAAGLILDHHDPNSLWHIGGMLCVVSAIVFYLLHLRVGQQERFAPAPAERPVGTTGELEVS